MAAPAGIKPTGLLLPSVLTRGPEAIMQLVVLSLQRRYQLVATAMLLQTPWDSNPAYSLFWREASFP